MWGRSGRRLQVLFGVACFSAMFLSVYLQTFSLSSYPPFLPSPSLPTPSLTSAPLLSFLSLSFLTSFPFLLLSTSPFPLLFHCNFSPPSSLFPSFNTYPHVSPSLIIYASLLYLLFTGASFTSFFSLKPFSFLSTS